MDIEIILLKKCCSHGYKTALKLKSFLDSKGHNAMIRPKKPFRYEPELKKYNKIWTNQSDQQAIYLIKELNICLYENEVGGYIHDA